ncbi:GNAT family N-acetyltransferase [Curtobacterium sp. L1-20]|uniref:GNAT family N-acetyltransferase n=1 Tax=Curtobacterium sp. L1-20 TaxID=3138181 RepID=UPI003B52CE88
MRPDIAYAAAWSEAHREWGPGLHEDGFGITPDDDVDDEDGFRAWVERLHARSGAHWWIVGDGRVLGGIALRSPEDPSVPQRGHVGYGIRPSARGRGVATWALGQVLVQASRIGIDPVLAVCRDDNSGSTATLERHGAVLVSTELRGPVRLRHYAIATHR